MSDGFLDVEVVFALPDRQVLLDASVPAGASVRDAIEVSGIASRFPGIDLDTLKVGIWGRAVDRDAALRPGDRVEIYRPLEIDPKEARRQLARAGLTMKDNRDGKDLP